MSTDGSSCKLRNVFPFWLIKNDLVFPLSAFGANSLLKFCLSLSNGLINTAKELGKNTSSTTSPIFCLICPWEDINSGLLYSAFLFSSFGFIASINLSKFIDLLLKSIFFCYSYWYKYRFIKKWSFIIYYNSMIINITKCYFSLPAIKWFK